MALLKISRYRFDKYSRLLKPALLILFSILFSGLDTAAQTVMTNNLAVVEPAAGKYKSIAKKGTRVFSDQNIVFRKVPSVLKSKAFVQAPMKSAQPVMLTTTGLLYIVTPATGELFSQEDYLKQQQFKKVDVELTGLLNKQKSRLVLYSKQIEYKSFRLPFYQLDSWAIVFFSPDILPSQNIAAHLIVRPEDKLYSIGARLWQGCPSIEKTGKRLWGAWFSGGEREPAPGNYGIVSYSDNEGKDWVDPAIVISHPDTTVRVMDPQLWKDPDGSLWIFWVQNSGNRGFDGVWGTWAVKVEYPEKNEIEFSSPYRLCNGLTRNKPIVLSGGEWLLPSYQWVPEPRSTVYLSSDKGKTWNMQGGPLNQPDQNFYEHMIVELRDHRIWLLQRNIKSSFSADKGVNWSPLNDLTNLPGSANSRLYIGRLKSGRLLLVFNEDQERKTRKNLTAYLSEDDGQTWPHKLLLDDRVNVSYPDAVEDENGMIYLCYDRGRREEKEILMIKFTEDNIINGSLPDRESKMQVISKVE